MTIEKQRAAFEAKIELPPVPFIFQYGQEAPEGHRMIPFDDLKEIMQAYALQAIAHDRQHLAAEYTKELDKVSQRNYELKYENAELKSQLDRQQRGDPVAQEETERTKWLASLFPEDRMFEEIADMARESYRRHMSSARGQQTTRGDSQDSHVIWATKRWIEQNEPSAPQPTTPTDEESLTVAEQVNFERKVYHDNIEYSGYLHARFNRDKGNRVSFDWDGHRWKYVYTSFDDDGEYDLLQRPSPTVKESSTVAEPSVPDSIIHVSIAI